MSVFIKIIALTIVMILAFSAAMVFTIFCFVGEPDRPVPLLVAGAAGSVALCGFCLWMIIRWNNDWKTDFIRLFDEKPEELLGHWMIPTDQWRALAEYDKAENREMAPLAGGAIGLVLAIALIGGMWKEFGAVRAIAFGGGISAVIGLLIFWLTRLTGSIIYRNRLERSFCEVAIRPDGMLINHRRPIAWTDLIGTLEGVEIENLEELDFPTLAVHVRQSTGRSTTLRTHRVPIPEPALDQAREVVNALSI